MVNAGGVAAAAERAVDDHGATGPDVVRSLPSRCRLWHGLRGGPSRAMRFPDVITYVTDAATIIVAWPEVERRLSCPDEDCEERAADMGFAI